MKFNWGFKIALVYGIFVMGIMYMVFLSSKQNRDLVSENYYAEELAYQKVIDQSSKTASLQSKVEISFKEDLIQIKFPNEFMHIPITGTWTLYYAASQEKDIKGNFKTGSSRIAINIPKEVEGNYILKLVWKNNKEEYYFEQPVYLR